MKIVLNPDHKKVIEIRLATEKNGGYCPCEIIKSNDTLCPCKIFKETKECHCGLYVLVEEN